MKHFFSAALFALLALCGASSALAVPTLSYAGPASVTAGEQFELGILVDDISDLYAYNLSVRYAPGAMRFVSQQEGGFLQGAGTTFFIEGAVDEAGGIVSFTGASLIGAVPGADGGGVLFTLTFAALAVADQTLVAFSLEDALFLNASLEEIGMTMAPNFSVRIVNPDTGEVPEPAVPVLLLAGAVALAVGRRRPGWRATCRAV
ncbi:cohesin domain-containing protein [Massilia jejuensis]|uniref:Cohesin domain-containing protein n=1 Tax=Massilia jejuensis TaxID=648894 RepID=A0ABW0PNL8_9BURK